jgi:hypothetical protein
MEDSTYKSIIKERRNNEQEPENTTILTKDLKAKDTKRIELDNLGQSGFLSEK